MKKTSDKNDFISGIPEGVEKHRLNKAYILVGLAKAIKSALIPVIIIAAGAIYGGGRGTSAGILEIGDFAITELHIFLVILIIAVFAAVLSVFFQYLSTYWFLTDTETVLCKGLINKKITRMSFEKIHSISTNESLVERAFGVVSLKIDSAGGATSGDITIPSLKIEDANKLREEIKMRMQTSPSSNNEGGNIPNQTDQTTATLQNADSVIDGNIKAEQSNVRGYAVQNAREYKLTAKEILLAGLANGKTLLYLLIGFGAIWQIIDNFGLDDFVIEHGEDLTRTLLNYGIPVIIGLVILILVISWLISVLSFAIKFYGFSIRTEGDRIETQRGLLNRITTQISINRIQEIHITQDILERAFGYATIKAEIATSVGAADGNENSGMGTTGVVLHPFIKKSEIDGYIAAFIPEFVSRPTKEEIQQLPQAACRRSFLRYIRWTLLFWIAPIIAFFLFVPTHISPAIPVLRTILLVAGIVVTAFLVFTAWRAYKGRGIAIGEKIVAIRHGAYKTTIAFIPKRKIQVATMKQNPFQRASKVAHIYIHTAANGIQTKQYDVSEFSAKQYLEWATPNTTMRKTNLSTNEAELI